MNQIDRVRCPVMHISNTGRCQSSAPPNFATSSPESPSESSNFGTESSNWGRRRRSQVAGCYLNGCNWSGVMCYLGPC